MANKRKDILLKTIIEDFPRECVRFFYKNAAALFNLKGRFESLEQELRQIAPDWEFMQDSKMVDKLLKCSAASEMLKWLLLLIEIQGYYDPHFTERVFRYFSRLLDKYGRRVMVLVIYTDTNRNYHPRFDDYQMANTKSRFDFETYKVLDQDEALLSADPNFIALVVLTILKAIQHEINGTDESLLASKIMLVKNLKNRALSAEAEAKLLTFIRLYAAFENPEMNHKFEKEIEHLIHKTSDMGIIEFAIQDAAEQALEKGIEKGRQEKNKSVVKNLLQKGKLTLDEIADTVEVSQDFVRSIKMQLG